MQNELLETRNQQAPAAVTEQVTSQKTFIPRTDIFDSVDQIILLADLPGVKQDALDISLERNILTISGSVERADLPGFHLVHSEFAVGDYKRVFALSNEIDKEGIQASLKNGVLKLVLPKNKRAAARKIALQVE
jgi:HSP20 family molecular chaperone IbpA